MWELKGEEPEEKSKFTGRRLLEGSGSKMAVFKDCKVNIEMYPRDKVDEGRAIHSWVETEFVSARGAA